MRGADSAMSAAPRRMGLPAWVPQGAQHYLAHTENGTAIRALARRAGCHASTIMRQIRRVETRRDDPLVDHALRRLGALLQDPRDAAPVSPGKESRLMSHTPKPTPDDATLTAESIRVLRRLCESGAVLAFAPEMEKAVVVRDTAAGPATRTAVVDRQIAEALSLKDWIAPATRAAFCATTSPQLDARRCRRCSPGPKAGRRGRSTALPRRMPVSTARRRLRAARRVPPAGRAANAMVWPKAR